jgi:hypothetical protein
MLLICRANRARYRAAQAELENGYLKGINNYSSTITESFNLLLKYKGV